MRLTPRTRPRRVRAVQPMLSPRTGCASLVHRFVKTENTWICPVHGTGMQCVQITLHLTRTAMQLKCRNDRRKKVSGFRMFVRIQMHLNKRSYSCVAVEGTKVKCMQHVPNSISNHNQLTKNQKVQNSFHSSWVYTTGCKAATLCNVKIQHNQYKTHAHTPVLHAPSSHATAFLKTGKS